MSNKQIPGEVIPTLDTPSTAPTGNVGADLRINSLGAAKPSLWMITVVITGGASDATLWGAAPAGAAGSSTDDRWGKVSGKRGERPLGVLGAALPVGTYHFFVEDIGVFSRLYVQKSANTMDVYFTPILFASNRGN